MKVFLLICGSWTTSGCSFNTVKYCFLSVICWWQTTLNDRILPFHSLNVIIIRNNKWKYKPLELYMLWIIRFPKVIHANNNYGHCKQVVGRKLAIPEIFHPMPAATSSNWFLWNSFHPWWPTPHTLEPDRLLTPNTSGALSLCDNNGEESKDCFLFQCWSRGVHVFTVNPLFQNLTVKTITMHAHTQNLNPFNHFLQQSLTVSHSPSLTIPCTQIPVISPSIQK